MKVSHRRGEEGEVSNDYYYSEWNEKKGEKGGERGRGRGGDEIGGYHVRASGIPTLRYPLLNLLFTFSVAMPEAWV